MRRPIIIAVALCLVIGSFTAVLIAWERGWIYGNQVTGHTVLVYDVDREQFKEKFGREINVDDMTTFASKLETRLQRKDGLNNHAQPIGTTQMQISIPFTRVAKRDETERYVNEVKSLLTQSGSLDFRIYANAEDDKTAVDETVTLIEKTDPKVLKESNPPPVPNHGFELWMNGAAHVMKYEWVELGDEEIESNGLNPNSESYSEAYFNMIARSRGRTHLVSFPDGGYDRKATSYLIYSRDTQRGTVEYFVLTRANEPDVVTIEGDVRISVRESMDDKGNLAVGFTFNPEGTTAFTELCDRNYNKFDPHFRNLAIVLNQKVISAPTLNAKLTSGGIISGRTFNAQRVNDLIQSMRAAGSGIRLQPEPVSVRTVNARGVEINK